MTAVGCGNSGSGVLSRGDLKAGAAGVAAETVGPGHIRYTLDLAKAQEEGYLVGDHHCIYVFAKDASKNSADYVAIPFDYQASPHLTLRLGDAVSIEQFGAESDGWRLEKPDAIVLSLDGYEGDDYYGKTLTNPSFKASKLGTGTYPFINNATGAATGAVVTVVDSSVPDDPIVEKRDQTLAGTASYAKTVGDDPFALDARLTEGDGAISYASSDSTVASVDESGYVTVGKAGTATITVKAAATDAYNAASMDVVVEVSAKENPPVEEVKVTAIYLDSEELELEIGQSETLLATVSPSNASNGEILLE